MLVYTPDNNIPGLFYALLYPVNHSTQFSVYGYLSGFALTISNATFIFFTNIYLPILYDYPEPTGMLANILEGNELFPILRFKDNIPASRAGNVINEP